jgi:NAD(P)-dependent dehydrogenase (short-subunit alcohol dehydrogenase family)
MPNILIIGATRGLGASLANAYAAQPNTTVFGTTRQSAGPTNGKIDEKVLWIPNIDVSNSGVGARLVNQLGMLGGGGGMVEGGTKAFDVVVSCRRLSQLEIDNFLE